MGLISRVSSRTYRKKMSDELTKEVNTVVSEISSLLSTQSSQARQVIPRWRFCPEIDVIFRYSSAKMKSRFLIRAQLDARSMNAFLERVRTFDDTWKFATDLSPIELAARGWKHVANNVIQCTEDLNKTLITCTEKTTLAALQEELAFRGCTFALKICPVEIYESPINFYTTISYKGLIESNTEMRRGSDVTLNTDSDSATDGPKREEQEDFLTKQFEQMELCLNVTNYSDQSMDDKMAFLDADSAEVFNRSLDSFLSNDMELEYPRHVTRYTLSQILKFYFKIEGKPTNRQLFICCCLLYGWCTKFQKSTDDVILFCFITGNSIVLTESSLADFHPVASHWSWSPWRKEDHAYAFYNKLQGRKLSFNSETDHEPPRTKRLIRRHSGVSSNTEVSKFLNKLTNLKRRKRRRSQMNAEHAAGSHAIWTPDIRRSKSFVEISDAIEECHMLCVTSLRPLKKRKTRSKLNQTT